MPTVRRATPSDTPALVQWLLRAAQHRAKWEPQLWLLHPQAGERLQGRLENAFPEGEREALFVAEEGNQLLGFAWAERLCAPPVYREQWAGLTGEWFASTPDSLSSLLDAAEQFQREGEVANINAACPAQDARGLGLLLERGYEPLTLWMTRAVNGTAALTPAVRPATEADLPDLTRLHVTTQAPRMRANARFWTPHPQAAERFAAWMRHSLTLMDRDLLVGERAGQVSGFLVAQPAPLPPAHDSASLSLIDDWAADDWAADDWETFLALLTGADHVLARRGKTVIQAICPANWLERRAVMEAAGFRTANLWLMKKGD